jgi:hypothetical protein
VRKAGGGKDRNEYYRRVRQKNEDTAAAHLQEVYSAVPAAKKTDDEIAALNMDLVKTLTSGMREKQGAVDRLNREILDAIARRKELLTKAGFSPDYTDILCDCPRCHDKGILENGASCACYTL